MQRRFPEHATPLQLLENDRIRVLYEHPPDKRHVLGKLAAKIYGLEKCQSISLPRGVIVRAESGRHVNDTGSFIG